jgi:NNP family nitrate/nitrite transporter-like MFS transporter
MTTTVRPDQEPRVERAPARSTPPRRGRWIDDWRPEDEAFWAATGASVARRNLVVSIFTEHVGFAVWSLWSVLVLFLGPEYGFDAGQKFLLTTLPTLFGSLLRVPYTLAVARFGGRNWTVFSAVVLLVPCLAGLAVLHPGVSFPTLLAVAALAGVGGGNFASSMANINAFYPQRLKGWALGLNAGGGNLGVAAVQLVGLAVLATAGAGAPRLVIGVYIPLIVIGALAAALRMNNLTEMTNEKRAMREVMPDPHTWIMSALYIGTFGSFIGLSFAFGQVLQIEFKDTFDTAIKATYLTFLGPLLGSLARPVGGRLADRFGGARVTASTFAAMAAGGGLILAASAGHSLGLYIAGFVTLFVLTGVGNGSTYKMIPAIHRAKAKLAVAAGVPADRAAHDARRRSAALIGLTGAIGAFGGVLVNLALRQSFLTTKTGNAAYLTFGGYYLVCLLLTWAVYLRARPGRLDGV